MKKIFINAVVLMLALAICPAANSQKKANKKGAKIASIEVPTLSYKFIEGKEVKYLNTEKIIQTLDINGQQMDVNVNGMVACSVKSKGSKDGNISLEVRIDSIEQFIDSPQGSAGGKVPDVKGKVFNMVLSPSGKEIDISEAKLIAVNIEGVGQSDAAESFNDFFPDLPAGTISPGFTWTTKDSISSGSTANSMVLTVKADNKFEGYEIVDGVNCAKISSTIAGTRIQNTETMGMSLVVTGPYTGTSLIYFAVDEGYLLKQTVTSKLTGTMEITSQGMSIPIIMDLTSVKEVRK
jgi:hypothetical protein